MKRFIVVAAGTVALMSGAAYAGGCAYGEKMASDHSSSPVISSIDEAEELLKRKLKAAEQQAALEDHLLETPVIHN